MPAARRVAMSAAVLIAASVQSATARPLEIVNVGAPKINCVFDPTCQLTVSDTTGSLPIPGGLLQSRTFKGGGNAPGSGKTGHIYRINLAAATGGRNAPCISGLKLDFGPVQALDYDGSGKPRDVYVISTGGGLGTVGLKSAEQTGNFITFTFTNPICAGVAPDERAGSYFFGLLSANATATAKSTTAQVLLTAPVAARVPTR